MDDYQLAKFYESQFNNTFKLLLNQYLVIKNKSGEVIDGYRWDGVRYQTLEYKAIQTQQFGKFRPNDIYQRMALDSLHNNQMTMIKGKAGTGKSKIALEYSWNMIDGRGKYDKLICFVNPLASRNSAKLGYYPGTRDEKLLDSAVGSMLGSKFGDKFEVEHQIRNQKLMLLPFSDIRGFDTTGMKAIVWIVEAQNLDVDLMKLAIQRIGEDSKLIIDGDFMQQVDATAYEGLNNGMRRTSQVFRDTHYYGEVELPIIYRSKLALKADEM